MQLINKKAEGVLYFEGDHKLVAAILSEASKLSGRTLACVNFDALSQEDRAAVEASDRYYEATGYHRHNNLNEEDYAEGEEEAADVTVCEPAW